MAPQARKRKPAKPAQGDGRTSEDILKDIGKAQSTEEVLGGGSLTAAESVLDVPLVITEFRTSEGEFGDFAVIEAANRDTGEAIQISCGSAFVMAQLAKLEDLDSFPVVAAIQRKATRQGYRALRLVAVDAPGK